MSDFKRYTVTLTGISPLLMHSDDLKWADELTAWLNQPGNKKKGTAGDDRYPAWRWVGSLYVDPATDGGVVSVSSDNIATMLREGGAKCPTGKRQQTFKALTQSGLVIDRPDWPVLVDGKMIPVTPFRDLVGNDDFQAHEDLAVQYGFELFAKRAKIGASKHVRVRPRFNRWSVSGTITATDDMITKAVLENILTQAGRFCGIGDWRPSSPKSPGQFGRFTATVKEAKK